MTLEDFYKISGILQDEFDDFWNPSILKGELKSSNSEYIVAILNEEIVGFAGIIITPDDTQITNIVTKKNKRKNGIGRKLLEKLIEMSKKHNKASISLEVNENNIAAITLYESLEFVRVGLRKNYYNGKDNAIIMEKKI